MKIVLANWGSRGEIEPCVAIGRELLRRGHEVRVAVAPDLVDFVEAAGVTAVAYGLDFHGIQEPYRSSGRISSADSGGSPSWARCGAKFLSPLANAGSRSARR